MGRFHVKTSENEVTGLIEEPKIQSLPGGLLVRSHLIQVRPGSCAKVKVLIHNIAEHAITLQPQRAIAECSLVDWVKPVKVNESYVPDKARMLITRLPECNVRGRRVRSSLPQSHFSSTCLC